MSKTRIISLESYLLVTVYNKRKFVDYLFTSRLPLSRYVYTFTKSEKIVPVDSLFPIYVRLYQKLLYLWQENKLMESATLPGRPAAESICLNVTEQDRISVGAGKSRRRTRLLRPLLVVNAMLILIVLVTLYILEFGPVPNIKLGFYCRDPALSFPYYGDTISNTVMLAGSIGGSLVIFAFVELYRERSVCRSWFRMIWKWFGLYVTGFMINLTLVELAKVVVGEHRPHFLATCIPDKGETCVSGEYVDSFTCTNTVYSGYQLTDSSRSFPSGHTSVSVYSSLFCAYYIQSRLQSSDLDIVFKPLIIVSIFAWSLVCSFTRISDHRHHWWDVAAGAVLGVVIAYYIISTYCKHFHASSLPSVAKKKTERPSSSMTTLMDVKNKDATSVII